MTRVTVTDIDALVQTVREVLDDPIGVRRKVTADEALAALDDLAHELKRLKVGRDSMAEAYRELEAELDRVKGLLEDHRRLALGAALDDAQRELERVKAERDACSGALRGLEVTFDAVEARLDKARKALQRLGGMTHGENSMRIIREALEETE